MLTVALITGETPRSVWTVEGEGHFDLTKLFLNENCFVVRVNESNQSCSRPTYPGGLHAVIMDRGHEEERMKQVICYSIGNFCENFELDGTKMEFSKQAIAIITEFVYRQSQIYARDAEDFAHHAKRKRINADDIILCARHSPSLLDHLKNYKESLEAAKKAQV